MAQATGWAVIPASLSFAGVGKQLQQEIVKPASRAAQQAGQNMTKQMVSASDKAAEAVKKARYSAQKSAEEQTKAEEKLIDAKSKAEQAVKNVQAAEADRERVATKAAADVRKAEANYKKVLDNSESSVEEVEKAQNDLNDARLSEESKVIKAENRVQSAQDRSRKSARDVESAQEGVEQAMGKAQRATDKLADKQKDLEDAQNGVGDAAEDASGDIRTMGDEAESAGGIFDGFVGKIGGVAGALAGVASVGAFAGMGKEFSSEVGQINRSLGLTGAEAEATADQVQQALSSGTAAGAEEAAGSISALQGQFDNLGQGGEQTAGELSDNFLGFARTFDVDVAEATQMAGQLIQNDFAPDVESAADLMTTAMQQVPEAMRGEVQDAINEYGTNFRNLGYDGEEAFSLIVGAADQGQYAIDKTGDSIKEFANMAVDPAKAEAFETLGMNADQAAANVAEGGEGARQTLEETAQALLDMEDPGQRAATAIELFGAPIEDLGVDQIPAFLENLTGVENTMGDTAGASQELADSIGDSLGGRMDSLKGTVQSLAGDAFMYVWDVIENQVIPAFQGVGDWIQRNQAWIGPLAAAIGGAAAAFGVWTAAIKGWQIATKIATGVQAAFNLVMKANPIMLVVTAIAALAAGLVYFFTQTETGRQLWEQFTNALGVAWDWVTEKLGAGWNWLQENVFTPLMNFVTGTLQPIWESVMGGLKTAWDGVVTGIQWAWQNIFQPVFNGIWQVAQVTLGIIGTVILTPLLLAWEAMSAGIQWAWQNIIKPAWDALSAAATWMWENVLSNVFTWIQAGWDALVQGIQWAWQNILKPAWDAVSAAATWLWENVLSPVFTFIGDAWNLLVDGIKWYWENVLKVAWDAVSSAATWMYENVLRPVFQWIGDRWNDLSDAIKWAYDNIIKPTWDALQTALTWLYENIIQPTFQWISDRWDDMANALEVTWQWISDNVFDPLGDGLTTVEGWFESAVNWIGEVWDWLKEKTAAPINFVIEWVFNKGIRRAWNAVAGLVGMDDSKLDTIDLIGGYAKGGVLPGWSPGVDDHLFYSPTGGRIALSGGEAIMRPEWTRAVGGPAAVDQMNRAAISGRSFPEVEKHGQESAAFAHGGVFDLGAFNTGGVIGAMINIVSQKYPQLTMTSGHRPGDGGMHGAGLATDWSNSSGNSPAQLALAHDIAATYPGSAELIYDSPGWSGNIKDGRNVGPFGQFYTLGQAGPHHHHVHWGMTVPPTMPFGGGVFEGGSDGGGGGIWQSITGMVKGIWDGIINAIPGYDGDTGGPFGEFPGEFLSHAAGVAWDYVKGLADNIMQMFGGNSGSVDVDDISGPVVDQVEQVFARHGFTGAEWDAAKWIIQKESSWDPTATNPSSGAFGLFQFNPMGGDTLGTYLPSRSTDPAVQADAGARYIKDRYGTPTQAKAFWEQNGWYDSGGWLQPGVTHVTNATGEPEPVFNPWQWRQIRDLVSGISSLEPALRDWVDHGIAELERIANSAEVIEARQELEQTAAEAGRGYVETQASSILDIWGLGELVPLASDWVDQHGEAALNSARSLLSGDLPEGGSLVASANLGGNTYTIEIPAQSANDFVQVSELEKLGDRVDGIEVKLTEKTRQPAAYVTRGGAM